MESWLPWLTADEHVLLDLLPPDAQVVLVEPRRMRDRAADLLAEEADLAGALATTWDVDEGVELPRLHVPFDRLLTHTDAPVLTLTNVAEGPDIPTVDAMGWGPVVGDGSGLADTLKRRLAEGWRVVVAAEGTGSAERLDRSLRDLGVGGATVVVAPIERGVSLPNVKLAVVAEGDVTGRRRTHRRARPRKRESAAFFEGLHPGAFVVHVTHGVGKYEGMVKRAIGGVERDYLLLAYKGGDKLYVPSDQIDAIRPYTGGETPALHRLGGSDFAKAKARVRSAAQEIAQELVVLYQKRVTRAGRRVRRRHAVAARDGGRLPYKETPDQDRAIQDVKADMESEHPMDRLVCGDVGFGKTEVAIRAAFKAVQDGYQVAVLVPTTLLAQQHFTTFSDRFAGYPVRVEVLSRFLTNAQAKKVLQGVSSGEVDVVIGTHRLLSEDLSFKKLGLLVVDEEQRLRCHPTRRP
jgi:transcription-repair coupling factor (superfamily II helicase)